MWTATATEDSDGNIEDITPGSVTCHLHAQWLTLQKYVPPTIDFFWHCGYGLCYVRNLIVHFPESPLRFELGGATCISRDKTRANKFVAIREYFGCGDARLPRLGGCLAALHLRS